MSLQDRIPVMETSFWFMTFAQNIVPVQTN